MAQARRLTEQAFHTVTSHSLSYATADGKPVPVVTEFVRLSAQYNQPIRPRAPLTPDALEIRGISEAILALQRSSDSAVCQVKGYKGHRLLAVLLRG